MKNLNKTKLVVVIIVALVVIAAIILGVILIGKNKENPSANAGTISKTESEFEPLAVKNLEMTYNEEKNETLIVFLVENKTNERVEKQKMKIHLLDENDGLIAGLETNEITIDPKGSHKVDLTLAGNIKTIKKLKLVKPDENAEQ